jgi:hypothetical protein
MQFYGYAQIPPHLSQELRSQSMVVHYLVSGDQ